MLADLAAEHDRENNTVYGLSFHVDYWNRLGWTDPFSDAAYTTRQRSYARVHGWQRVYTPQAVVNGDMHVVGSHRDKLNAVIAAAIKSPAQATVKLTARQSEKPDGVAVQYATEVRSSIEQPSEQAKKPEAVLVLQLAVVESKLSNDVPRGENAGKHLAHANVVRALHMVRPEAIAQGRAVIETPDDLKWKNVRVIGYVQDYQTGAILGAGESTIGQRRFGG